MNRGFSGAPYEAGENRGECYGMPLVYSGNFLAQAEVDQLGQTRFVMGIHPQGFRWRLEAGEEFTSPEVIFSFSDSGYGKLSGNFYRLYRERGQLVLDMSRPEVRDYLFERISIQYGTSFGYPVSSMGAHVSVSPNLQTGRVTPFTTRGIVAMAGVLGYELDVCKLSAEERELVKEQIRWYQKYQELILYGDYYRLTEAEKNQELAAWQFVSRDQRQALVSIVCLRARSNPLFGRVRLKGLKEDEGGCVVSGAV